MLKLLKRTTKKIQEGNIELLELCSIINNPDNSEIIEIIPNDWINFISGELHNLLDNSKLWKIVAANECCLYTKFLRRFFPINQNTGDDNWRNLSKAVLGEEYPHEQKDGDISKPSNYESMKNMEKISNLGAIPVMESIDRKDAELVPLDDIFKALITLDRQELIAKTLYLVLCNYKLCHRVYEETILVDLIEILLKTEFRGLILDGMFYSQYIFAQEENLCQNKLLSHRFVFNSTNVYRIQHIFQNIPLEHNPLLVNCMPYATNIYQTMPFYLKGKRSLASKKLFKKRLEILTHGALKGVDKFESVAVVGSALVECLGNNPLLMKMTELKTEDDENIKIYNTSEVKYSLSDKDIEDMENFKYRSELYYSADGGDIDIAISEESYKKFIRTTEQIIEIMNTNIMESYGSEFIVKEMCVGSGIRYHLTHPKLKRKFEIFRVPRTHIDLVSSFHVACVRMYWNFKDLWMTRGCVASMLTGVNESFNWFSSNKVPTDVLLKYAQRGYTTILNHKELTCLEQYISSFGVAWNYGISNHKDITGAFKFDHPFFRVDIIPKGIRYGKPALLKNAYIDQIDNNSYKLKASLEYDGTKLKRYKDKMTGFHISRPILF